ncbi:hypothetical protein L596_013803 [Steinernema carpocapsae]|uniref:TIL domain-containing protein n=1 Tax=Steinernema carpocapsae TaxID=34508 RepID=A0A4U5P1A1_STECR|nr:hypothetical protein L596_013803 [Steinernema carpocapsae]
MYGRFFVIVGSALGCLYLMVYGDTVATTTDPSKQCKDNEDYYMCKPVCLQYCTIGHSACADYCEVGCDCKATSAQCKENEQYYTCKPSCPQLCTYGRLDCSDYCEVGCECKTNYKRVNGSCINLLTHCAGHGGFLECNNKTCGANKTKPLINYVCVKTIPRICTWACPCDDDVIAPKSLQ